MLRPLALGHVDESDDHPVDDPLDRLIRADAHDEHRASVVKLKLALENREVAEDLGDVPAQVIVGEQADDIGQRAPPVAFADAEDVGHPRGEVLDP